jgi:hypothetical protein
MRCVIICVVLVLILVLETAFLIEKWRENVGLKKELEKRPTLLEVVKRDTIYKTNFVFKQDTIEITRVDTIMVAVEMQPKTYMAVARRSLLDMFDLIDTIYCTPYDDYALVDLRGWLVPQRELELYMFFYKDENELSYRWLTRPPVFQNYVFPKVIEFNERPSWRFSAGGGLVWGEGVYLLGGVERGRWGLDLGFSYINKPYLTLGIRYRF